MDNRIKFLSYNQIQDLIRNTKELRTQAMITFEYASAARIGEIIEYHHELVDGNKYTTQGLLKSNINNTDEEIVWAMSNFKVKKEKKKMKYPFILKEETLLWEVAQKWLSVCGEQVFSLKEARARQLIRQELQKYGYSSHALRRSRGTHLADMGYNIWEIMEYLGHTTMESGMAYISPAGMKQKLRERMRQLNAAQVK